jgi:hypothetical protein
MLAVPGLDRLDFCQDVLKWKAGKETQKDLIIAYNYVQCAISIHQNIFQA